MEKAAWAATNLSIDLFYSTRMLDPEVVERLMAFAGPAGVTLHVIEPGDGFLTVDRVFEQVPESGEASFWFCGPGAFGQALKKDLVLRGFAISRFHQEVFEFR